MFRVDQKVLSNQGLTYGIVQLRAKTVSFGQESKDFA